MLLFTVRAAIISAILLIAVSTFLHIISSPWTLILLSPLFVLTSILAILLSNVAFGYVLDLDRKPEPRRLHSIAKPLVFSTPAAWQAVLTRSEWTQQSSQSFAPLYPDFPKVSAGLDEIISLIIRDFVVSWYKDISNFSAFPNAVSVVIHESLANLVSRTVNVDLAALVVKRLVPKITTHIEQFRQSEIALRGDRLERKLTQSEELDLLLASRYAGKGSERRLHPAIDNLSSTFTKHSEESHLRQMIDKILPILLPETEAQSQALRVVVREIAACAVLYPIMDMIADPDFWNRILDQVAGEAIHQQKLITKVRHVLEAQSSSSSSSSANRLSTSITETPRAENITIHTDVRQFESFLRSISRCSSLLDARRLKNDVMGEIRRTRMLLANHENEDWINGEKTEDVVAFLDRLYTAKRKVEERIVILGGGEDGTNSPYPDPPPTKSRVPLRDILRNPSSLSYFMEFMDRRNRSLPVQFWLTVESFKNPLESVDSDSSADEADPLPLPSSPVSTAREDITMIYDLYFSGPTRPPALSAISQKHIEAIRAFAITDNPPNAAAERKVRRSVLLAQRQIERDMEQQDFEDFERSELWFRVVGDIVHHSTSTREESAKTGSSPSPNTSIPRSESTPALVEQPDKPASVKSGRSSRSAVAGVQPVFNSRSHPSLGLGALMSPIEEPTRAPLFDDPDDRAAINEERAQIQRMEAIQAALTDIIAGEEGVNKRKSIMSQSESSNLSASVGHGTRHGSEDRRKRRGVFDDYDEIEEQEREEEEAESKNLQAAGTFTLAAPGDLHLSYEIARLSGKITHLERQETMLDTLIRKAELTGDAQELRLLNKSKSAMARDLRELRFQKTQYEQQESANRLHSDRTRVAIVSSTAGEEDGKSVVRYLVQVQQLGLDESVASGWVVARRYNEFLSMHNKLKERFTLVRQLDFPGKRLVTSLSGNFVDNRRQALERYMQNIVAIPIVCESNELRAFLSRDSPFMASEPPQPMAKQNSASAFGKDLVRTVYRSVTESIDDMFFGPSMLDVMILRLTRQAAELAGIVGSSMIDEDLVAQALKMAGRLSSEDTLMRMTGDLKPLEGETSTSSFSAPICDLVLAIFELNKKNNWLRRQAIVIILQQVLGGTIERKIRENVKTLLDESRVMSVVGLLKEGLWPGGRLKTENVARTQEEKLRTRDDANRKLSALIPDLGANMIGRSNARRGARRMFAVLQNRRLNQHIAYTILDEIILALFPETAQQQSQQTRS